MGTMNVSLPDGLKSFGRILPVDGEADILHVDPLEGRLPPGHHGDTAPERRENDFHGLHRVLAPAVLLRLVHDEAVSPRLRDDGQILRPDMRRYRHHSHSRSPRRAPD